MRWLKIIGGIVAVVVIVVVGALAYVATLDPEQFRGTIETAAKDATGRDFAITGPMDLELSLSPRVVAENITLANAAWGSRPEMVKVKEFEVVLSLLPLVFGEINIVRVVLIEPDILLETDKQGTGNWVFETAGTPAEAKPETAPVPGEGGPTTLPSVDEIRIERGLLVYRDGVTGAETRLALDSVTGKAEGPSEPLVFDVDLKFNEAPISAKGSVGPLANAMDPGKTLDVDVTAEAFGIKLSALGTAAGQNADMKVAAAADTLTGLKPVAGDGALPDVPLKFDAQVKGGADKLDISELKLTLGDSDLSGSASVALSGKRPRITADLSGQKLDLAQLMPAGDGGGAAGGAEAPSGTKGDRVFPSDPLPVEGLRAADADVSLKLAELVTPSITLHDTSVKLTLENGALAVKPATAKVAASEISLALALDASRNVPTLSLDASAPNLDVGKLLNDTGTTDLVEGTGDFILKVDGQGRSVAEIMGSLNGNSSLLMGQGRMRTQAFDTLVGGLSSVMGTLFSGKSEWTVLNCAASRFDIKQGIATSQIMLVDTEYSTVVGEGNVDLGQEQLNLMVTPQAKSVTLNVAVPVKIRGSFVDPKFSPDELATARRIGGLLGGLVFPPAALGALADMGTGDDNPCLKIAKGGAAAAPAGGTGAADQNKSVIDQAKEAPKEAIDSVTKGLKDLLGGKKE